MKTSQPRQRTVKKYTDYLRSLIIKIDKNGNIFEPSKFCREGNLPSSFVRVCEELGFIRSIGNTRNKQYHTILRYEAINPYHGRKIAETILNYNMKHSEQYINSKSIVVTKSIQAVNAFIEFTDTQLLDELQKRGYRGELHKTKIIKI